MTFCNAMNSSQSRQDSKLPSQLCWKAMVLLIYFCARLFLRVFLFCWEIKVAKMQRVHQTIGRDLQHVVPMNLQCKSCFVLPVKEEFALFAVILAFRLSVSISGME